MSIHFETARCIVHQHQSETRMDDMDVDQTPPCWYCKKLRTTFDSRDRRPKEDNIAIGNMPGH